MRLWQLMLVAPLGALATLSNSASSPPANTSHVARNEVLSHCRSGEAVAFSCRFRRTVGSVCAGGGQVHYRYGPIGSPSIDIGNTSDWSNIHLGHVVGGGGGHESHIRFTNGETHYIVFEVGQGQLHDRPGHYSYGIAVVAGERGEREIANFLCRSAVTISEEYEPFRAAVASQTSREVLERLEEVQDGPFDGWL